MAGPAGGAVMAVEPAVGVAGVVKDAVEDQAYAVLLGVMAQTQQRLIAAKLRVDVAVIFGVIFMHAGRDKHRVEVERGDAELFQVRQLFADTVQIAAVKGRPARLAGKRLIPVTKTNFAPCGMVPVTLILLCGARFATGKAIREDLVEDLIGDPRRAFIGRIDGKLLKPGGREAAKLAG